MQVKLNLKNIAKITENSKKALLQTAEALKTDLVQSQTMPFDSGVMQNDSTFIEDKKIIKGIATIKVDTPYARKVYFDPEIVIHTEKNKNAKQYWFEDYISGSKKNLPIKYFKQFMKGKV